MTRRLSTQAAAFSLATLMTLAVLLGLNGLASPEHAATQLARTVAAQPA
jgi:hypothetical protein